MHTVDIGVVDTGPNALDREVEPASPRLIESVFEARSSSLEFFGSHISPKDVSILTVEDDVVAVLGPVDADQSAGQLLLRAFTLDRLTVFESDELTLGKTTMRSECDHGRIRRELHSLDPCVLLVTEGGLNRTQHI